MLQLESFTTSNAYRNSLGDLRYLSTDDRQFVYDALDFAFQCHKDQTRLSGEAYIKHPIAAAAYLAKLKLDKVSLASALLHDVVEDCGVEPIELQKHFGREVRNIVEGVTKLSKIESKRPDNGGYASDASYIKNTNGHTTPSAKSIIALRRVLVATASDVRVIVIKLADRLHNVSTLEYMAPEKRKRIADETLKIYAPLAHRLGIADLKWRLEDHAFKHAYPAEYRMVSQKVNRKRNEREKYTEKLLSKLKTALKSEKINCIVYGRPKHLYSVYKKWLTYRSMNREFDDIYDLVAFRVITNSVLECYLVLGIVHNIWNPVHKAFDDYISNPKENNYQSLHTAVMGYDKHPFEVQIRTHEMHKNAEEGVAAHWVYKEHTQSVSIRDKTFDLRVKWLQNILKTLRDIQEGEGSDREYIQAVEDDVLGSRVFVYTPNGDLVDLPSGATPLDFAYAVHTELGHSCIGAIVNGKACALSTTLSNGDTVEIRKSKYCSPKIDWINPHLKYVISTSARSKIKSWFRAREKPERIKTGESILNRQLKNFRIDVNEISQQLTVELGYSTYENLLEAIGSGRLSTDRIAKWLANHLHKDKETQDYHKSKNVSKLTNGRAKAHTSSIVVMGQENMKTQISKCCLPEYGDPIIGYVSLAGCITVHKSDCSNLRNLTNYARIVGVSWGYYPNSRADRLEINGSDRVGLIRDITDILALEKVNIHSVKSKSDKKCSRIRLTLCPRDTEQLAKLIDRISDIEGVNHVAILRKKKENKVNAT